MDINTRQFRYRVLFFNCLLTFGSYFCFDMPANLEDQIKQQIISKFTTETNVYYNYFYVVYSWTNMIMSICAGIMIDRIGKVRSMYIFLSFCMIGSLLYAAGAALTFLDPFLRYLTMFIGRFIFGLGGGPITIVQNAFTAIHFTGHELAMAFGCTLTVSRIGSVINFDLTPTVYEMFKNISNDEDMALSYTLFAGAALVLISFFAGIYLTRLDNYAQKNNESGPYKKIVDSGDSHNENDVESLVRGGSTHTKFQSDNTGTKTRFSLHDVKTFPLIYWFIVAAIACFYSIIFPFMADSSSFLLQEKFNLDHSGASFRAGLVYMCSMFISPFLGAFVDWFGRRENIALFGTAITVPAFILLRSSTLDPVVAMILIGVSYSVCAAALWPSIQIVVPIQSIGTANGMATSIQMLGIGICNIIVGYLRDNTSFDITMLFFLGLGITTIFIVILMRFFDEKKIMFKGKRDYVNDFKNNPLLST